jgi:hemolysin III
MPTRAQTSHEEIANTVTHGIGLILSLIGLPFLLKNAVAHETTNIFWAVLAFGLGMIMVYASSTMYHAVQHKQRKDLLQIADHVSIYFLIAGSYTPLVVNYLPKKQAAIFLLVMWSLVAIGVLFKLFFTKRFNKISVLLYLTMGWMIIFIINPVMQQVPTELLWWILIGGISYTVGVYFYVRSKVQYFHAIWHCFVLGGTASHYIFIYKSILP